MLSTACCHLDFTQRGINGISHLLNDGVDLQFIEDKFAPKRAWFNINLIEPWFQLVISYETMAWVITIDRLPKPLWKMHKDYLATHPRSKSLKVTRM